MSESDQARQETVVIGRPLYGGLSEALTESAHSSLALEVPFAIEGERVQISAANGGTRHSFATLDAILESAPGRVLPRCIHFGTCGGCQYQHMADPLQLRTKSSILQLLLKTAGVPAPIAQVHAAAPYAYRNRMRLRVQDDRIGYNRRASNDFLPITQCPIVSPLLWHAAETLNSNTTAWPRGSVEVELFATADDTALQLALHLDADVATLDRDNPAMFRALCTTLQTRIPQLVGGGLLVHAPMMVGGSRRVQERQRIEVVRWGSPSLIYTVDAREYTVSRGAFFQVNRFLTGALVDLVVGHRSGSLALDLFAGTGLFSLPLSGRFLQVLAVEVGQPAATDLHRLLQSRGPQHRAIAQTALAFLKTYRPTMPPDLIILDPPRAGVGAEIVRELVRINAPEIIYISCDPTTFARDARTLLHSRYAVTELHLLDLFPQTFHMETVAVFRRQ